MSKTQEMQAGRKIDAVIHEEIFELSIPSETKEAIFNPPQDDVLNPKHLHLAWAYMHLPYYSTNIEAAMPVLEWLRNQFFSVEIVMWDYTDTVAIQCNKRHGHNEVVSPIIANASMLPEAISLAALKAVEEKNE